MRALSRCDVCTKCTHQSAPHGDGMQAQVIYNNHLTNTHTYVLSTHPSRDKICWARVNMQVMYTRGVLLQSEHDYCRVNILYARTIICACVFIWKNTQVKNTHTHIIICLEPRDVNELMRGERVKRFVITTCTHYYATRLSLMMTVIPTPDSEQCSRDGGWLDFKRTIDDRRSHTQKTSSGLIEKLCSNCRLQ